MRLRLRIALWGCIVLASFWAASWNGSDCAEPIAIPIREQSAETLAAAIKGWKEKRTARDFFVIVAHIPKGTPAKEVVEKYLGEPRGKSGYWANVTREWYYLVEPPPDGAVCTVFISRDEKFVSGRDKRRDK
jgi:hypothetical protein